MLYVKIESFKYHMISFNSQQTHYKKAIYHPYERSVHLSKRSSQLWVLALWLIDKFYRQGSNSFLFFFHLYIWLLVSLLDKLIDKFYRQGSNSFLFFFHLYIWLLVSLVDQLIDKFYMQRSNSFLYFFHLHGNWLASLSYQVVGPHGKRK